MLTITKCHILTELGDSLVPGEAGEDGFAAGEGLFQQWRQRCVEEGSVCGEMRVQHRDESQVVAVRNFLYITC